MIDRKRCIFFVGLLTAVCLLSCHQVIGITDTQVADAPTDREDGPYCGDRTVQTQEQCDDGNQSSGDGCSSLCHWEPKLVSAGGQQTCALGANGVVKCWGDNYFGELGVWDNRDRGVQAGEMGDALPPVWLGSNEHLAKDVATGHRHTCAILDDDAIRCWGGNANGQGNASGVVFQLGRSPIDLAAGAFHTCALFEGATLKCWGANDSGQLGVVGTHNFDPLSGDSLSDLPPVNLGTDQRVRSFALGGYHTCALLETGSVKCWGKNDLGQLGIGDSSNRGRDPAGMGDALAFVNLGQSRTAKAIAAGNSHVCAILDDDSLKCWGSNSFGQLGLADGSLSRGRTQGEMGDALPAVDLGPARARAMALGSNHTCVILDDDTVRCWGRNEYGQLGLGDTTDRGSAWLIGSEVTRQVDFGQGRIAKSITAGTDHTCALLDDGRVKCWGYNGSGQLGLEDSAPRGIAPNEMGDELPWVNLTF